MPWLEDRWISSQRVPLIVSHWCHVAFGSLNFSHMTNICVHELCIIFIANVWYVINNVQTIFWSKFATLCQFKKKKKKLVLTSVTDLRQHLNDFFQIFPPDWVFVRKRQRMHPNFALPGAFKKHIILKSSLHWHLLLTLVM